MTKALLIPHDDLLAPTIVEFNSITQLQELVRPGGCLVQILKFTDNLYGYIDEEGKMHQDICINSRAQALATVLNIGLMPGDFICGNLVLVGPPGPDGEETDCLYTWMDLLEISHDLA